MGQILTKTVDRAISKGWIPSADKQNVIQKIEQLSSKYGFRPDDFAIFTHVESYGMKPNAFNSSQCAGIIQFCPDRAGSGRKTIGGRSYSTRAIANMSILAQLDLVDAYLNGVIPASKRGGMDLGNLYFYVLYPGIGAKYASFSEGQDLRSVDKALTKQADALYEGGSKTNPLTKASVRAGLRKVAAGNLGNDVVGADPGGVGTSTQIGSASLGGGTGGAFGNFGFQGGLINGACKDEFPVEFTMKEAIEYVGCFSKIIGNVMGVSGLGYPSNGMRVNGASAFTIADFNPAVPICAGCLGHPFRDPTFVITSPFCIARPSRSRPGQIYYHSGTDYATTRGAGRSEGVDVVAIADGTVIVPAIRGDGYEPGFVDIVHEGLGNLVSRSAHIIPSVAPGTIVRRGDVIGKVGPYGNNAAHLHLELRKDKGAGGGAKNIQDCKTRFLDPGLFCRSKP